MPSTDTAVLISLFHTHEQAQEALADLRASQLPPASIQTLGHHADETQLTSDIASLQQLDLPSDDQKLLSEGLRSGGIVVIVSTTGDRSHEVESIFKNHRAHQVDEQILTDGIPVGEGLLSDGIASGGIASGGIALGNDIVIPIVEEELVVGKRAVQGGGVRVYSRITETPVQEQVTLHEEHAVIERRPVDRVVTGADANAFQEQSFEVTEMSEEPVVSKTATVIEEIVIGKDASNRTERVTDTVRRTEVDVEQMDADTTKAVR